MTLIQSLHAYLPGYVVNVLRLLFWLVLLAIVFVPLERWFAVRNGKPGRAERWQDLGFYFLSSLLPALLLATPLAMLAVFIESLLPPAWPAALGALPFGARLALSFVIVEIGFYWGHRLSHSVPWLWRFHAVHHSPTHLYFMVHTRSHPVDLIFTRLCALLPLYVLGLASPSIDGAATPVVLILVAAVWGFFIHANLRVRLGPLEWLIATPAFHHWHHSRSEHLNRNFAATLPLLDKLFGTLHLPPHWPSGYGIDNANRP
jgi:sterol desaturase/sphingolipid hydroxylase (fatty acid hydroxylase superfamily)